MKLRTRLAVLVCKVSGAVLRRLGRGGTNLPGRLALKIDKNILGELSRGVRVTVVTGTNGKTTTSRMIEQAFADAGLRYFSNKSGANLLTGIIAVFAQHCTLSGKCPYTHALIECDEAAFRRTSEYLPVECLVVNNIFRDQLVRYGEITHTLNAIREGITEYEVALISTEAMVHEIAKTFPHREVRDTWVWFQSGINTDGAHNWATTRKLQRGDILSLNCFPMTSGYYTALERTLFLGEPDARSLELWNVNVEVHKRGLELIKPGAVCKDIAAELNEIYIAHGLLPNRTFGYGHSFGVLSHYYGREAGLELREDIDTVLEPGMVVSMEPMITIMDGEPGAGGYREHDILVINEDNTVENITKFGFGPENNIIDA